MELSPIELDKENMYRRAMQALDLMSLHFSVNNFNRHSLALTILVLELMHEIEIVDLSPGQDMELLQKHLSELASSPEE